MINNISEIFNGIVANAPDESNPVHQFRDGILHCGVDTEFNPILDRATIPVSIQLHSPIIGDSIDHTGFYIHPNASERVLSHAIANNIPVYQKDMAIFDYTGWEYKSSNTKEDRTKYRNFTLQLNHYWAIKDIELGFKRRSDYINSILPYITKTRRHSSVRNVVTYTGESFIVKTIPTDYLIKLFDAKVEDWQWFRLVIEIVDLSAMQGFLGQKQCEMNVGFIDREEDEKMTHYDITHPEETFINKTEQFIKYGKLDAYRVSLLRSKTNDMFNKIADILNIKHSEDWGLTTGRITGTLLHNIYAREANIEREIEFVGDSGKKETRDILSIINVKSGTKAIAAYANYVRKSTNNKQEAGRIHYLSMCDGGRAVRERLIRSARAISAGKNVQGAIADIDIGGCYGNGLKNQLGAVGIPRMLTSPITLRKFLKDYVKKRILIKGKRTTRLIPGLWYARINWKNAPFKSDLLLSKDKSIESMMLHAERLFNAKELDSNDAIEDARFDLNFALLTNQVHQAALNHDLLQVLNRCASKKEWEWLLDNAEISSALWYDAVDEKKGFTDKECKLIYNNTEVYSDKKTPGWIRIQMEDIMDKLLRARKSHPKNGTVENKSMNSFLKLVINTIFGCTASEFFSEPGRTISNVVIGNNITARARALGWLMAKGFHSHITVTDGGTFDVNQVMDFNWKYMSLNALERLSVINHEIDMTVFVEGDRNSYKKFAKHKPLFNRAISFDKCDKDLQDTKELNNKKLPSQDDYVSNLDARAWQHLKEQFGGNQTCPIDILDKEQFDFETKDVYIGIDLCSKINYRLIKPDGSSKIAYRGLPKIYNEDKGKKVINPIANDIFDSNKPSVYEVSDIHIISLNEGVQKKANEEYVQFVMMSDEEKDNDPTLLLPGDTQSIKRRYYTHTPLYMRHETLSRHKEMLKQYGNLRNQYKEVVDGRELLEGAYRIASIGNLNL